MLINVPSEFEQFGNQNGNSEHDVQEKDMASLSKGVNKKHTDH